MYVCAIAQTRVQQLRRIGRAEPAACVHGTHAYVGVPADLVELTSVEDIALYASGSSAATNVTLSPDAPTPGFRSGIHLVCVHACVLRACMHVCARAHVCACMFLYVCACMCAHACMSARVHCVAIIYIRLNVNPFCV